MNDQENAAAEALLVKLKSADPDNAVQLANAYQALTQGAANRKNAETPK